MSHYRYSTSGSRRADTLEYARSRRPRPAYENKTYSAKQVIDLMIAICQRHEVEFRPKYSENNYHNRSDLCDALVEIIDNGLQPGEKFFVSRLWAGTEEGYEIPEYTDKVKEEVDYLIAWSKQVFFKTISGNATQWQQRVANIIHQYDDGQIEGLSLEAIAGAILTFPQTRFRMEAERRMNSAFGRMGTPGDQVSLNAEVVRANYSEKWNTFFIQAVTEDNYGVFFSHKEEIEPKTKIRFSGRVKAHRDNITQLHYVKKLEKVI